MANLLSLLFLCVWLSSTSAWLQAVDGCVEGDGRKYRGISLEDRLCDAFDYPSCPVLSSVSISTTQGMGVGFNRGYSSIGLVRSLPWYPGQQSFSFVEGNVHLFNDCKMAANLGAAMRVISNDQETVFGGNVFYDVRQAKGFFHQIGCGIEAVGERYALSVNGYFPLHKRSRNSSIIETYTYTDGYYISYKWRHHALTGGDIQLAARNFKISDCSRYVMNVAIGSYFYKREYGSGITGARLRVGIGELDKVALNVEASYDSYFNARMLVGLLVSFPCGPAASPCARKGPYPSCCDYPIQRQEIIAQSKRYLVSAQNF